MEAKRQVVRELKGYVRMHCDFNNDSDVNNTYSALADIFKHGKYRSIVGLWVNTNRKYGIEA